MDEEHGGDNLPVAITPTVNITAKTSAALDSCAERIEDTRTGALQRAVQIFDILTQHVDEGGEVLLRGGSGDLEKLYWS